MVKVLLSNKNCFLVCLFWFASLVFLKAQTTSKIPAVEKIYLHTDRSTYFLGEDLWYKAYDVYAYNNKLYDNSNILYVELISPEAKIVARNKTNLELGLGAGDFQLIDSLGVKTPGIYQIRAYTNWNRNYNDDFVFKKEIEIIDAFDDDFIKNNLSKITSNSVVVGKTAQTSDQQTFSVDFFPEGGSLLENVGSIVGFKAQDSNGKPVEVKGEVFDANNESVSFFMSAHDGMGKFPILPIEGKQYYAKIKTLAGAELRVDLPSALKQGYVLNFKSLKGRNIVTINTNEATLGQNLNAEVIIICTSRGLSYFETTQKLTATSFSFELPKDKIPEGINQLTLYDSNLKPQSERLVFIEKDQDLEVILTADKSIYKPKEKTTLNVVSKSKAGVSKSASFSLSVTDMNGLTEDKDYGMSISSYFLMESDIRGKVHNPGYYFDSSNLKRLDHLDNLLLTQGWRDFLWKKLPKANDSITYKVEKGFTISGRVKQLLGEKAKVNSNVTLSLMNKKHMNFFGAKTDSIGGFKFENLMFSGKINMFLNASNDKGKVKGEIVLDSIEKKPMLVSFEEEPINWTQDMFTVTKNVNKKFTAFGVKPENILNEVKIVAPKKKRASSLYGIPDFSYVVDEKAPLAGDIYNFIQYAIPGVVVDGSSVRFMRYTEPVHYILNGFPIYNQSDIDLLQPIDIERIEAIKGGASAALYGSDGNNGVIAIYTKPNAPKRSENNLFNTLKNEIDGFYMTRVFYMPDPQKPNVELDNKAAVRNTIYWNPYVHPDTTGNAHVSFDNTDFETKVKVDLEGITATGIPVVKNTYYTIKK
ncbi:Plug domain-containing protein [Flavobacterium seoulense]|uniref:TonB-dependent receptor plug domain-containing protein n=1 Tax=Flavobacterium seoulense TaxID=1492738 RepID=A0A066WNF8_9FLAO|nr:Plug domain-containing protein [Flavobacterium seoulense]KDN55572.1 hypothetical protein FEM21_11740 [Flavobacterium seoulense]